LAHHDPFSYASRAGFSGCSSCQHVTTNRREQLFVKRVEIEAEKLFRILLLAILYTDQ
jgi:hypothetical protein